MRRPASWRQGLTNNEGQEGLSDLYELGILTREITARD
jgi:hypothetical protein